MDRPRRTPAVMRDIIRVDLERLAKRTRTQPLKMSRALRNALAELFEMAFADAVAHDERMKWLEGLDRS